MRNVLVQHMLRAWGEKADRNIAKWGLQDIGTLTLAMAEEVGELAQAVLKNRHENGSIERIKEETNDLAALCVQMAWAISEKENSNEDRG